MFYGTGCFTVYGLSGKLERYNQISKNIGSQDIFYRKQFFWHKIKTKSLRDSLPGLRRSFSLLKIF